MSDSGASFVNYALSRERLKAAHLLWEDDNESTAIVGSDAHIERTRPGLNCPGRGSGDHRHAGSPGATTTISGKQLPPPDPKFGGVIKDDALQSKPWWAPRVVPPKGAPNVLLIITDDAGFGVPSTFGGVIPTPTHGPHREGGPALQPRLLHRAVLADARRADHRAQPPLGRLRRDLRAVDRLPRLQQHHRPRTRRRSAASCSTTATRTSWFGKDHNTPAFAASQVGPFDQWPTGMGFEYFYGFVGGDANQWQPNLFRNTTQIYPFEGKPGWNLVTGMADDAIDYMTRMHQTDPNKPIFIKYAPGATHAPHHPTKEWVDKISKMQLSTRAGTSCASASSRTRSGSA